MDGRMDGAEPPIDNWDAYEKLCYSEDEPVVNIKVETRVQTSLGAPAGEPTAVWKYSKVSKRIQKHVKANGCFKYLINFLLNSIAVYKRFQKNHHTFVHLPSFFQIQF